MKVPTRKELVEFKSLFNEFRNWKEEKPTECVTSTIVKKLIDNLAKDDALRVESERLIRYNRYLTLRTLCAPYFFANCSVELWSNIASFEKDIDVCSEFSTVKG
jgi:hypothetical protein